MNPALLALLGARAAAATSSGFQFVGMNTSPTIGTDTTFSNVSFGAPAANRLIVGIVHATNTTNFAPPSTWVVDGVSYPRVANQIGTQRNVVSIYSAAIPEGETGTVTFDFAPNTSAGLGIWVLYGATLRSTAAFEVAGGTRPFLLTTEPGDVVIAGASSPSTDSTWAALSEQYQTANGYSGAHTTASEGTSTDVSIDASGLYPKMAAVSYALS